MSLSMQQAQEIVDKGEANLRQCTRTTLVEVCRAFGLSIDGDAATLRNQLLLDDMPQSGKADGLGDSHMAATKKQTQAQADGHTDARGVERAQADALADMRADAESAGVDASIMSALNAIAGKLKKIDQRMDTAEAAIAQLAEYVDIAKDTTSAPASEPTPTPAPKASKAKAASKSKAKAEAKTEPAPAPEPKGGKVKSKAEAKRERERTGASNSARYTCSCGGWGVQEKFQTKHAAKGHTVTTLR